MKNELPNIRYLLEGLSFKDSEQAFQSLYYAYSDKMMRYIYMYVKSHDVAEELVSDVFFALWERRKTIHEINDFNAYIYKIAKFKALNHLRDNKPELVDLDEIPLDLFAYTETTPEDDYISKELIGSVNEAIEQLPPKTKLAFKLVREDGMKLYREEGFPVTIVRPSYTYDERKVPLAVHGTQGTWSVVKRIIDGKPVIIHGDGTALWTMTHNSDFAKGFAGLIGNIRALGEAVQITSDETLTWNQIYQCIARAVNRPLKAVHVSSEFLAAAGPYDFYGGLLGDKAISAVFDNTKLKRLVPGFVAVKRFDEGIKETIESILAHPEYQQEDPEFDTWTDKIIKIMQVTAQKIKSNENYDI
ncbi:hypothetical protein FACS1894207_3580 [Bacteroidia bacterium]|nr:hypothetical protein FACS1894207_3580 [Bacteroidia bacterium]